MKGEYLDYLVYEYQGRTMTAWLPSWKAQRVAANPDAKVITWLKKERRAA